MLGAISPTWEMAQEIAIMWTERKALPSVKLEKGFIALQSLLAFFQANLNFVTPWSCSCPSPKDSAIQSSPLKSHCTLICGETAEGNLYWPDHVFAGCCTALLPLGSKWTKTWELKIKKKKSVFYFFKVTGAPCNCETSIQITSA